MKIGAKSSTKCQQTKSNNTLKRSYTMIYSRDARMVKIYVNQ
jgi:hypothetical protein